MFDFYDHNMVIFDYYEHNMSLAMVVREVPYELPTKNIFADVSHDKSEVEE